MSEKPLNVYWLGTVEYGAAWQLQRELASLREARAIPDTLLLLEHPPTITLGRRANALNVLASVERLSSLGVAVFPIDRGGDVTYHGPGQLVGYPIFHLEEHGKDLHRFLRNIEAAIILFLAHIGIEAVRFPPHTGVWVDGAKVAAIGIKISRWVSAHGFALNVAPNREHFDLIIPCGIRDHGITDLATLLQRALTVEECLEGIAQAFFSVFNFNKLVPKQLPDDLSYTSRDILARAKCLLTPEGVLA